MHLCMHHFCGVLTALHHGAAIGAVYLVQRYSSESCLLAGAAFGAGATRFCLIGTHVQAEATLVTRTDHMVVSHLHQYSLVLFANVCNYVCLDHFCHGVAQKQAATLMRPAPPGPTNEPAMK